MLNEATRQFVSLHTNDDVRQLALQAHTTPDVDLPTALDQIRGRQTARQKLPSWAAVEEIVYPPHLSMEQCSSEQTAQYKAQLLARLVSAAPVKSFIDLTGGFGVDFAAMAKAFLASESSAHKQHHLVYVEKNEHLCALARHNFPLLGLSDAEIICDTAENFLKNASSFLVSPSSLLVSPSSLLVSPSSLLENPSSFIFLDPARRDAHGNRTYALADCTPNVLALRDELLKKAHFIVLKLSPMLDWHRAVEELGCVSEVHIVSVANECKEMLLVMKKDAENRRIFCVNDEQVFSCGEEAVAKPIPVAETLPEITSQRRLFVPNASVMKAGCFGEICQRFGLDALAPNSRLFVNRNATVPDHFPGKIFQISAISSMNKRDFREKFAHIDRANISTRNFPMKPEELRRRLKIKEGGDNYIFATTLADGKHVLILCEHMISC
ncbi:MAG: SAM-dependent methyltransferase [Prevotella sp.]|nr:SAM-dependent methyltransferase [Prevotella sp.]